MKPSRSVSAFTLVDLLVALAVLVLGATVLLPALSRTRSASQGEVSRANLKHLIRAHASYSLSNQGRWMNPFNPTTNYQGGSNSADPEWYSVRAPNSPGYVWRLNDPGFITEMYSLFWASASRPGALAVDPASPVQFDPRDQAMISRLAALAGSPQGLNGWLWPTSYMYSPTMWFNPARYADTARLSITAPNQLGGVRSVRYNTTAQTTYPALKAVLFQRLDFDQTSRPGPQGPVPLPPQWNNSSAKPDVAFADGSVDEVGVSKIAADIERSPTVAEWLRPTTPAWNLPDSLLYSPSVGYELPRDFENGQIGTTAWPAYFWGTRSGVNGRDVARR